MKFYVRYKFVQKRVANPDWQQTQLNSDTIERGQKHSYRRIKCWDYIIQKFLDSNKLNTHKALYGSSAYDDCGKLVIVTPVKSNFKTNIDKAIILKDVNTICLPYFDITYDDIEIL